jgi:glycosyltransferase involved in cell wall biosynthesis
MRGSALHFFKKVKDPGQYDLLLTSDLMSLSDLKALWGSACPPSVVYFHESQLSYPLPPGEQMDYQFGFTDITTGLTADGLIFNSHSHKDAFFENLPGFIGMMPEYRPNWAVEVIEKKSIVLYPGCRFPKEFTGTELTQFSPSGDEEIGVSHTSPPLIIWNHRWEFDKDPETFFSVLGRIDDEGIPFNLALLGENFQAVPKEFIQAKERYGDRILQYGWVRSKDEYFKWLRRGDIVLSTSIQENFGISMVEAIRFGCFPLLPARLSYPELLPQEYHEDILYNNEEELYRKLKAILIGDIKSIKELSRDFARFSWELVVKQYDRYFDELAGLGK